MPRPVSARCRDAHGLGERGLGRDERLLGADALGGQPLDFDAQILRFDVQAAELAADPVAAFLGALDRVLQRRRRLHVGGGAPARRVDVAIERPDLGLERFDAPCLGAQRLAGGVALAVGGLCRGAARFELLRAGPRRAFEQAQLAGDLGHRLDEGRGLLLIERDLLLAPLVLQLALVRIGAQAVGLALGLGQLDAHALEVALDLGQRAPPPPARARGPRSALRAPLRIASVSRS